MIHRKSRRVAVALLFVSAVASLASGQIEAVDIPFHKYILDNGLTLIVHEDHKTPIVAVNVWYHVGSKNEKPGKTGFAHLFEHLMFNGSEHFNDDYFQVLEALGATDLNGTTSEDRTNYFQNVPASALDTVLWLESDRMGHLLGVVDQERLDEQRGVVQNEKRQMENQPYAISYELMTENTFPEGHPYSWTVIGSMEDLDAASLPDVQAWFRDYYGAANAVVVLAGDITPQTAKEKVEKYFGAIAPGPPVKKQRRWVAKREGTHRQTAADRVPQARIYKVWNVPEWGSVDGDRLRLVGDILSRGKTSRFYKRLVYEDQIATDVGVDVDLREIAGLFVIEATAKPGVDLPRVEEALDEELAKLLAEGPSEEELRRVRTQYMSDFIRGVERIGGFGGKSDILARSQVFGGTPDAYKSVLDHVEKASPADLKAAANTWLSDGVYILEIHPFPEYETAASEVDRSRLPEPGPAPELDFPELQRKTLSNGLDIILAERHEIPLVDFRLLVNAGYAADQFALPGTAKLAMDILDEGAAGRTALEISEELDSLGAELSSGSNLDLSVVRLSALKANLSASLDIFADVILRPSFPDSELQRLKAQLLARIQQEKSQPFQMALRVFPALLYGEGHAYGSPFTGSGTEESVRSISIDDLERFHDTWFKPNNATLIVVGDVTLGEITTELETLFAGWAKGDVPEKNIGTVKHRSKPAVYLIDKPGAVQSVILAGHVAPPKSNPQEIAMETLNAALGGMFISRLNMNLREDKHWSYGAQTVVVGARGQRPFIALAPVQSDKTKESMVEIQRELEAVVGQRPITEEELEKAQKNLTLALPGSLETMSELASSIADIVRYGLPDDYYENYVPEVRRVTTGDLEAAAETLVHPDNLVWVVVGDRSRIEADIRELGFGEVAYIDADGEVIQ